MAAEPSGLVVLDKPPHCSSHDCVGRLRRVFGLRRIGHAGTLDPLATGVLVVAVGRAARSLEFLVGADKTYQATMAFGRRTDSYDADGVTIAEGDPSGLTEDRVRHALARFVGAIDQVPPPVSAKLVDGQRLYQRHRAGLAAVAPAVRVAVHRITLDAFAPDSATAEVTIDCGSGVYIRAIADDLGQALGCGAHLAALRRTRVGRFTLDEAVDLTTLEAAADPTDCLLPAELAVEHLPAVRLSAELAEKIRLGIPLAPELHQAEGGPLALRDGAGRLLAVGRVEDGWLKPRKVLAPAGRGGAEGDEAESGPSA